MALDTMEYIPAFSPYRVGTGKLTAERYQVLSIAADELIVSTPGATLGNLGKALLILHLFESGEGNLDKSGMSVMGISWSKGSAEPTVKTSYWLLMEQMATGKRKVNRGTPLVERSDKNIPSIMRMDNKGVPTYEVDADIYTGG